MLYNIVNGKQFDWIFGRGLYLCGNLDIKLEIAGVETKKVMY